MRSLAILLGFVLLAPTIKAAGLNDTGQSSCYNAVDAPVACSAAVGGDVGTNPRQDARYGRDAQAAAATLTKVGAGAAGFDFSKIGNNGAALAATAVLGTAAAEWACTKDNVTGLIWEVKTALGVRSRAHTYTWYSTLATNGGNAGALGIDTCAGSLSAAPYNNQCNTQNYVTAVNAATLCGAADWRLPTHHELLSLVHTGARNPSIDAAYFPNPVSDWHWSASTYAGDPGNAWVINFYHGDTGAGNKTTINYFIRLVRGGP